MSYIGDLALGSSYSRWMSYDGLDRLTAAGSAMFGGDHWHRFTYDTLDNLKTWKLAGVKDHNYYYDPGQNRLTNVNTSTGAGIVGLSYDAQGNLSNRNGVTYTFDYGNRLREVSGKEVYRYDGHGRRVLASSPAGGAIFSQYTQTGQLAFQQNRRKSLNIDHIYLAGSLVATREQNYDTGVRATRYQHTDALGSPVAVTNESAQVIERTQWEPFGAAINRSVEGVGYTGHVMDAQTGLTYMQQRYYDPQIGRNLSVDPVTAYGGDVRLFNRYAYAFNNPYRFTDPDGRTPREDVKDRKDWRSISAKSPGAQTETSARSSGREALRAAGNVTGAAGTAADAGSVAAARGAQSLAQYGWQAGEDAAMYQGVSKTVGKFGAAGGFVSGGIEIATAETSADTGHGVFTIGVGLLGATGAIAPPLALMIGVVDLGVQQIDYTSTHVQPGVRSSGWSGLMAAGADGIETSYQRHQGLSPCVASACL